MNYNQICGNFSTWAAASGTDITFTSAPRHTLLIRDVANTDETLTGQIFYAVTVYTDRLHTFIYSEQTTWLKDCRGNTAEIIGTEYAVEWWF